MFVIGWLPVVGWLAGCLTSRLAGSVAGWQCGWLALRLTGYVAGWLAGYVTGCAILWLYGWLYWLPLAVGLRGHEAE